MPSRLRFAKRSSTRAAGLVAVVAAASAVSVIWLSLGSSWLAFADLAVAIVGAAGFALHLIVTERRRHEVVEEELSAQSSFLEALVESMGSIAATLDPDQVLDRTRREAKDLFGAKAEILPPGAPSSNGAVFPLRIRGEEIGALQLIRSRPLDREEQARAALLADFASRTVENARLLAEARVREAERARLSDQLITAEQDERRRLALFLHDGPVQSLSGIALMLDAAVHAGGDGCGEEALRVLASAVQLHRDTIRSLRDLSFDLEPVVLRDQGFGPAVRGLTEHLGLAHGIQIDVDVALGETLSEKAQVALCQIIREGLTQALRRGSPTLISISMTERPDGGIETVIADDGSGERRRASVEAIEERAVTLRGRVRVEHRPDGGTVLRIELPPYTARR